MGTGTVVMIGAIGAGQPLLVGTLLLSVLQMFSLFGPQLAALMSLIIESGLSASILYDRDRIDA